MSTLKQIEPGKIENRADEFDLIAQLAADAKTRRTNEDKARRLRKIIGRIKPGPAERGEPTK